MHMPGSTRLVFSSPFIILVVILGHRVQRTPIILILTYEWTKIDTLACLNNALKVELSLTHTCSSVVDPAFPKLDKRLP